MEAAVRSESPVLASDVLASDVEEVLTEVIEQLVRDGGEKRQNFSGMAVRTGGVASGIFRRILE